MFSVLITRLYSDSIPTRKFCASRSPILRGVSSSQIITCQSINTCCHRRIGSGTVRLFRYRYDGGNELITTEQFFVPVVQHKHPLRAPSRPSRVENEEKFRAEQIGLRNTSLRSCSAVYTLSLSGSDTGMP
jgi:hypothetical protein